MITYPLNKIEYQAEDAELFHCTRNSGIYANDDFVCTVTGADNNVTIGTGIAWIRNSKFSGKVVANKKTVVLDLGTAPANLDRIDVVAIRFDANLNSTDFAIIQGTPASSPARPKRSTTATVYELFLLEVYRPAGAATISSKNVKDLRLSKDCGLMADSVTSIDTSAIDAQIDDLIKSLQKEIQNIKNEEGIMLNSVYDADDDGIVDMSYSLKGGIGIKKGDNLNDFLDIGNYYCKNTTIAASLINSPTTLPFRMKVENGSGVALQSVVQTIYPLMHPYASADKTIIYTRTIRLTASGAFSNASNWYFTKGTPALTASQKAEIKNLMDDYFTYANRFLYVGNARRESYCYTNDLKGDTSGDYFVKGCISNGKYLHNCGVFAQFVWMGRAISDFVDNPKIPITTINTVFNWGYYFDFALAQYGQNAIKEGGGYFGDNTYVANGKTRFVSLDGCSAMAEELHRIGCEIPYGEVEVGDLVFYRTQSEQDNNDDEVEQAVFRNITHVGIVYDVDKKGKPIIIESSDAWAANLGFIGLDEKVKKLNGDVSYYGVIRAVNYERRVVMAARHPAAFGFGGNVPTEFTKYRGVKWIELGGQVK